MKKITLLLILSLILAGCSAALTGCSAVAEIEGTEKSLEEKETQSVDETKSTIEQQIEALSTTIEITGYIPLEAKEIYEECLESHPEYFWLMGSYSYSSSTDSDVVTITPNYAYDVAEIPSLIEKFNAVADPIIAEAQKQEGDFYKALYVYNYLLDNTVYAEDECDAALENTDQFYESTTAYGCLINGKALCGGYTNAFMYIMNKCGLECSKVTGYKAADEIPHVWNLLKMDGEYYHMDVTWDDPIRDNEDVTVRSYVFFGITTDEILLTHEIDNGQDIPECICGIDNYHIHEGYYMNNYDYETTAEMLAKQYETQTYASVKYGSTTDTEKAIEDFITQKKIFDIAGNYNMVYADSVLVFMTYRADAS